jgi:hypothetical protein
MDSGAGIDANEKLAQALALLSVPDDTDGNK